MPRHDKRRPHLIAFGGVIVDHVENNLDAGAVHHLNKRLEFAKVTGREEAWIGSEERQGVVAPVIRQPPFDQMTVVQEGVNRQQLDRGNPQLGQVFDGGGSRKPGNCPPHGFRNFRVANGESLDVGLVDDALVPFAAGAPVAAPGKGGVHHLTFGQPSGVVAPVEAEVGVARADAVAEMRVCPFQIAHEISGIGVDKELVRVETVAPRRIVGAMNAIAVELPRANVRQIAMPNLVRVFRQADPRGLLSPGFVEQTEVHPFGIFREQGEIHAHPVPFGATRIGCSRPDAHNLFPFAGLQNEQPLFEDVLCCAA